MKQRVPFRTYAWNLWNIALYCFVQQVRVPSILQFRSTTTTTKKIKGRRSRLLVSSPLPPYVLFDMWTDRIYCIYIINLGRTWRSVLKTKNKKKKETVCLDLTDHHHFLVFFSPNLLNIKGEEHNLFLKVFHLFFLTVLTFWTFVTMTKWFKNQ